MILIKNGELVLDKILKADLAIENGKIVQIEPNIDSSMAEEIIDASGCYVFPGFIDAHTHFAMTNAITTTADDFSTGTKAAILGGTTTVINFASPSKSGSLIEGFDENMEKAKDVSSCHYAFHMEVTHFDEKIKEEMKTLNAQGVTSFKVYFAYAFRLSDDQVYRALETVKELGGILGAHCENGYLIDVQVQNRKREGLLTPAAHPLCHTAAMEAEAINRFAAIGKMVDYPVHVVHLSSKEGLDTIRRVRNEGAIVTAETCPQYLLLDDSCYHLPGFESAKYMFSPPVHSLEDQKALHEAVLNGEIQTLATDHCSYNFEGQKTMGRKDFTKVPNGIPGVQQRGPLMYTLFVDSGELTPTEFSRLVSENPAKLYHLYPQKGVLSVGSDADIVLYKKEGESTITAATQAENVDYTPYEGQPVKGSVRDVFLEGVQVVSNGKLVRENQGIYVGIKGEKHV